MKTNPFWDIILFLTEPKPLIFALWLLIISSVAIAVVAWRRDPAQRTGAHLWTWAVRFTVGIMWWQQSMWKPPPTYTTLADGTGGLRHWMLEMTKHAAFESQARFVKDVVLENFAFFAPQVYFGEVLIAISLMLGIFTRVGATLATLMAVNLLFGLYRAPYEWPWTYGFLVLVNGSLAVYHAGRSLGLDALLTRKLAGGKHTLRQRLALLAT